ncbi:MAG: hypothetical protein RJB38_1245 [Pseudomonadota bacterium]
MLTLSVTDIFARIFSKEMAHTRERQLDELFDKLMAFSPLVGVFGHRQVGK